MTLLNRSLAPLALAAALLAPPAIAGTDVGVSISIAQPGVYGRIDIGTVPAQPVLVYPAPVLVTPRPAPPPPVYMWVPPGHAKNWKKHCREYNACGVPVYFVRDDWYESNYVPAQRGGKGNPGKGHGKGKPD
jgi:hypothetical protein